MIHQFLTATCEDDSDSSNCLKDDNITHYLFGLTLRAFSPLHGFWEIGDTYIDLSYLDSTKDPVYNNYCWTDNFMDPNDEKKPCPFCLSITGINTEFRNHFQHQITNIDNGCKNITSPHGYSEDFIQNCEIPIYEGEKQRCSVCKPGYVLDWMHSFNFNSSRPTCLDPVDCFDNKRGYYYQEYTLDGGEVLKTCSSCRSFCEVCDRSNTCSKCYS